MTPTELRLDPSKSRLTVSWEDGRTVEFTAEYLRVHSPSAEVKGHGPGQETLQVNKEDVTIAAIEPVGHYAVKLVYDDGHNTGLYSWTYLRELGERQAENWQRYLDRLEAEGYARKNAE
ncbi:MAG: DUF971 domain-containing protein [Woeseiaceae bacterium]|nr:DUF971 domain-containing protein [Woeseiaceae bacterium]